MLNKLKKKHLKLNKINHKKILIISLPILIVGLSVCGYFIFVNNQKEIKQNIIEIPKIDEKKEIFPEIESKDFYDLIEFENGLPFIGDKMIAAIIKDVITRLGSIEGNIGFYIVENSDIEKTIFFKWTNNKEEIKKTYIISINGL